MGDVFPQFLREGTVSPVHVQIIVLMEVVGDINIGISVMVQVADTYAQAIADLAAVYPCLRGNIGKMMFSFRQIVAVETVACPGILFIPQLRPSIAAGGMNRVVEQVHVQVTVQIVIKKSSLRGEALEIQTIPPGLFPEGQVSLVDEQFVSSLQSFVVPYMTHIDIQQAVAVHVGHGDPCFPVTAAGDAGLPGNIPESEPPLVQVKFICMLTGGKIKVREPVVVDISRSHAGAVVEVEILDDVELFRFFQMIHKIDVCA